MLARPWSCAEVRGVEFWYKRMAAAKTRKAPTLRLFDPTRVPATDEGHQLVAAALARVTAAERRTRARSKQSQRIHERALMALICDLTHRHLMVPRGWLLVELSKTRLTPTTRRAPFMTEQFAELIKAMARSSVGLVELRKGEQGKFGFLRSTMRAGRVLRGLMDTFGIETYDYSRDASLYGEPIELRGEKTKRFVDGKVIFIANKLALPNGEPVDSMRRVMQEINAWIASVDLDWIGDPVIDKVDSTQRFLKRIFNNCSFEHGGRLYGGFWQSVKSESRLGGVVIDSQPAASLDFAQSALTMAYAKVGVPPPPGDLYAFGRLGPYRCEAKMLLNALLSSDRPLTRFPRGTRGQMPKSWKFERVYDWVCRHHAPIVPLFGTGHGLRFMKDESEVLIRTLLKLKSLGITALPIHDCVLVASSNREAARAVMEESFLAITGAPGKVDIEGTNRREVREGVDEEDTHASPPVPMEVMA